MISDLEHITLLVEGMDCASCALGITKNLEKKGLQKVNVNFITGEASFLLEREIQLQSIIDNIHNLGYKVVDTNYRKKQEGKVSLLEKRFYFTLPFTVLLFCGHLFFSSQILFHNPIFQFVLCIPVYVIGLLQFGKSALGSIKSRIPNMDVLILLGSSSAFIYSIVGIFIFRNSPSLHDYLFFETTSTIITLVLLGNVIENRSVKRTTSAISQLSKLQATKANLVSLHLGKEILTEIDFNLITQGAILQVNMGEKIPVDGEIISGNVSMDESMITGETMPNDKTVGSKVIGGTIVLAGSVRMRSENVGNDTVLSKIISIVKNAQENKPEIQKLGDKISAVFVPVVLSISILTFLINYFFVDLESSICFRESMMRSIAVLVISCPCAMGLATPTAVMVGIGRAAQNGVLIKGGNTLEEFAKIKSIVFDKTGTLTTGRFKITNIECFENTELSEIKDIVFQLEQNSSHPIAKSIVSELKEVSKKILFENIIEEKGIGMKGIDNKKNKYMFGSFRILNSNEASPEHDLFLTRNGKLIATIDLEDEVKPNSHQVILQLKKLGIKTIMLSGDKKIKCESLGRALQIEKVYSEQLPIQKSKLISELMLESPTAMVGDGVNDAPALAQASIGISISNASQIAIQSSQIVLLKSNDISALILAHQISKHTLVTIKQNLFWAFFYNTIAIPVAAIGFLNPMIGALSMAFSDVIVIGNSIRLKTKKLN